MKFGENLYTLRKASKMSQEDLAEKVDVSRQSVSKWENGEAYPEMDNILKLCKIFHCKINDLIHEDLQDIDSLDQEIKMKVVKLKKEKQRKLKIISKIISVIAKIGNILATVGSICLIVGMILLTLVISKVDVINENEIKVNLTKTISTQYQKVDGVIKVNGNTKIQLIHLESEAFDKIVNIFTNNSKGKIIAIGITSALSLTAGLVLLATALEHLHKLFKNINEGDTPFTLENVHHIKSMAYLMIAETIMVTIGNLFSGIIIENQDYDIGFGIISILVFYSIAYIFEYGYEIQLDSNGKIYGEEDENE